MVIITVTQYSNFICHCLWQSQPCLLAILKGVYILSRNLQNIISPLFDAFQFIYVQLNTAECPRTTEKLRENTYLPYHPCCFSLLPLLHLLSYAVHTPAEELHFKILWKAQTWIMDGGQTWRGNAAMQQLWLHSFDTAGLSRPLSSPLTFMITVVTIVFWTAHQDFSNTLCLDIFEPWF